MKSEKAFSTIKFSNSYEVNNLDCIDERIARKEVIDFLTKRDSEILRRTFNGHITILDALVDDYVYNKEYGYYETR